MNAETWRDENCQGVPIPGTRDGCAENPTKRKSKIQTEEFPIPGTQGRVPRRKKISRISMRHYD
jgi:hypothetical protein